MSKSNQKSFIDGLVPTSSVLEMGKIHFQGNIIPNSWYRSIIFPGRKRKKKPDLSAIIILAEICYWYRPRVVKDESTGEVLRYEKRFKADKLQRSYQSFADQFGITKRQATEAIHRLVSLGAVTIELRVIQSHGVNLSNVLFIEPVPEVIHKLSTATTLTNSAPTLTDVIPITLERDTLPRLDVIPITLERGTYTEITTETTSSSSIPGPVITPEGQVQSDLVKAREEKKEQGGSHNPNHDVCSEPRPGSCDEPRPGSCDEPRPGSYDEHTKPIVNPLINSSIPGPVITPEGQVQSDLVEVKDHYPTPQEVIVSTDVSVPDTPEDGEKTQLEEKQIQGLPSKVAIEGQEPHGQDGQEQKGFTWENIAAILGTTMMNLNELDKQTLKGWIDRGITPLFVLDLLDSLSALPRKLYKMDKQVKTAWAKRDKTHENTPIPDINHNTRNNLGIGESENKKRSGMMDGLPGSSLEPTSCGYKPVEKNPRPPIIDPVMSRKERHEMYRQKLMEMEETP